MDDLPAAPHNAPWLQAIRAVAQEAALNDDRTRLGWAADDPRALPFAYRWEHIQQVVLNGQWLLTQLPADEEVVLAACWLHDVRKAEKNHAQRGAEFARSFLPTTDFPAHKVEAVANAIAQHEGLWRADPTWKPAHHTPFRAAPPLEPIEAAILWDADKLAKVGPVGLIHFLPQHLLELEVHNQTLTTEAILTGNRQWLDTIAPRTLASFNTVAAQRRAMQLHAAYELFWRTAEEATDLHVLAQPILSTSL